MRRLVRVVLHIGFTDDCLAWRRIGRGLVFVVLSTALLLSGVALAWANGNAQALPLSQSWTDTGQISRNNSWDGVPGISGYSGDFTFTAGSNPQTLVADGSFLGQNVTANRTSPNTDGTGGIAEFQIPNPTVALQPTDSHDLPHLVMNLDTRNRKNVNVSYTLRDIDGSSDNAAQQVMLQYRVGSSGNYTNLSAGYVADATAGPSATKETRVSVTLPAAVEGQALVQVRVGSSNAVGNDEWVGVDDISVSSVPTVSVSGSASPDEGTTQTYNYTVSDTDPNDTFSVKGGFPDCGAGGTLRDGVLALDLSDAAPRFLQAGLTGSGERLDLRRADRRLLRPHGAHLHRQRHRGRPDPGAGCPDLPGPAEGRELPRPHCRQRSDPALR